MNVRAPYLPYDKLRTVAQDFLDKYHTAGDIPVPIERIIEFKFGLDIVPIPGLKDQFDVDAYITNDLTEIRVDSSIQERVPNRYRFSLAHELSHFLVHKDVFEALKFSTIGEWKEMIQTIPEDQYRFIELQAYGLAGLILVPPLPLRDIFDGMNATALKAGIDISELGLNELKSIFSSIGRKFEVSADVIQKRVQKDKLIFFLACHRTLAAFFPASLSFFLPSFFARAGPPFRPRGPARRQPGPSPACPARDITGLPIPCLRCGLEIIRPCDTCPTLSGRARPSYRATRLPSCRVSFSPGCGDREDTGPRRQARPGSRSPS